jgi:hypothetical protein
MRVIYAARQMEVNESLERINCRLYACRLGGALVVGTRLDATVNHQWYYWQSEGWDLRQCQKCGLVEALGPGGWSAVP